MWARNGRQREMGLGPIVDVTLAEAREAAREARRLIREDKDPIAERDRKGQSKSFGDVADAYLVSMTPSWSNAKHAAQWKTALTTGAASLRPLPVNAVDTAAVLAVLQPLWVKVPETASRLRGRIEAVLDAAKAQGLRSGDNPAQWGGHLEQLLPRPPTLVRGHQRAMAYAEVPALMARLRERKAVAALALRFAILTAARTGEVIGATWSEFDLGAALWSVPAERMKMRRPHRVPLAGEALAIVTKLHEIRAGEFVFPGGKAGKPLSNMAMLQLLRNMKVDAVSHGFRSSFRDWAAETTDFPAEVAEMALAHAVADAVERAYRRGDLFEKRRGIMEAWATFCGQERHSS